MVFGRSVWELIRIFSLGSLLVSVAGNLISGPSTISISISRPGRRNIIFCRLRITRRSVNEIVNGRNEVTGTVHIIVHTTTAEGSRGVSIRVS